MKVLIVVARRYNGHELWTTLGILNEAGIEFEVISTDTLIKDEVTFQQNIIERTINEVDPEEMDKFDGLLVISGNMSDTEAYWDHPRVLQYVREIDTQNKPIGAICCSVPTIREATKGKKVSYYPLIRSKERLVLAGAIPQTLSVTVDANLVTAEHQMQTQMWAEEYVRMLKGEKSELKLVDSGFEPTGRTERSLHPRLERLRGTDISYRKKKHDN